MRSSQTITLTGYILAYTWGIRKQIRFAQLFSLDTGCVVVQRLAKQMSWLDRLLKIANTFGKRGKHANQRGHLNFLN